MIYGSLGVWKTFSLQSVLTRHSLLTYELYWELVMNKRDGIIFLIFEYCLNNRQ